MGDKTTEEKAALYDYLIRVGYVSPETCADRIADATADLTAQLQTAQATIERAHHESIAGEGRSSVVLAVVRDRLSRADTSAHDAAILAAKAEGWQRCVLRFASYGHIVKGAALDRAESENPYIEDPYRASIGQTEAK